MLNSLSSASRDEAVAALSAAVKYLSPHPTGDSETAGIEPGLLREVLEEVARRTKTHVDDERGRGYQLRYLSDELSRVVLPKDGTAYSRAAARLGERGELHPSLYEVVFGEPFDQFSAVPRRMATQVIQAPHSWQHLNPPGEAKNEFDLVSLFARTIASNSPERHFTVLVIGTRRENRIVIVDAFYLHHDVVNVTRAENTLQLLEAFLMVFGCEQQLAGQPLGKLAPYRRFELRKAVAMTPPQIEAVGVKDGSKVKGTFLFRYVERPGPALDIALAFAVDLVVYARSLRKHGVALPGELQDALKGQPTNTTAAP